MACTRRCCPTITRSNSVEAVKIRYLPSSSSSSFSQSIAICMAYRRVREGLVSNIDAGLLVPRRHLTRTFTTFTAPQNGAAQSPERRGNGANTDRDLLLSVLNASTTKRDAKAYLQQFKAQDSRHESVPSTRHDAQLAVVLLRGAERLDAETLQGVARTLTQLNRLNLRIVLVLDDDSITGKKRDSKPQSEAQVNDQADRLVSILQNDTRTRARRLDYILAASGDSIQVGHAARTANKVRVAYRQILRDTILSGTIPVIPAVAYSTAAQLRVSVTPEDVMLALVKEFTTLGSAATQSDKSMGKDVGKSISEAWSSVDRIIVLDPVGGLPSPTRSDRAHVFVNLKQEYRDIKQELEESAANASPLSIDQTETTVSRIASNPAQSGQDVAPLRAEEHLRNLNMIQQCLSLLPSSSSALLTTPLEAATLAPGQDANSIELGVATRRSKNPLIFSLLTNKPTVSSSLPPTRVRAHQDGTVITDQVQQVPATFFKKGMTISIIPDIKTGVWKAPSTGGPAKMSLEDDRIDLNRLFRLIEDSFGRPLDVDHYLDRVRDRIAGVIVAGDYEGGAILTWELPPGVPDDGSVESARRMVPYLDKFAVLKSSQGTGGVADIVFSAMVRTCFPDGVCWRSRKKNPVNKWYFERSVGTWKLPNTEWTMFWTTPRLLKDRQRFADYEAVCRSILPSWADRDR